MELCKPIDDVLGTRGPDGPEPSTVQQRVLRVAARLFAQRGFHAVSIRDIAAECNVSVSTVLYAGRTKRQLLEEILAESFRGEVAWPEVLEQLRPEPFADRASFLAAYDQVMELLVRHAAENPNKHRLWLRLLLDQPDLFAAFDAKYTWPLSKYGFDLLRAARDRGIIAADDEQLQQFVASADWTITGFFAGGFFDFRGHRVARTDPESVGQLLRYLKENCRVCFPPPQ